MQPIPQTKFLPPIPHRELIPRAGLVRKLQKELPLNRLLLLSAPAGYGKTTLLSSLPGCLPDFKFIWLSLEPDDNDILRFFYCLGQALGNLQSELDQVVSSQVSSISILSSTGIAVYPVQQWMTTLINSLLTLHTPPFVLVLDDLHEITHPVIFEALDFLLDHLPPNMHLALSTRHIPPLRLNRLRARRQMIELDKEDLRFSFSESWYFLNQMLKMDLSETAIRNLQGKTEGWPVGLVLLTNHLLSQPASFDPAEFLGNLSPIEPTTFHYLAEEVLAHQPPDIRTFLLETSILNDLTIDICREVSGRQDAEHLLTEIFQRNLFLNLVRPADETQPAVFRYHSIFVQYLQMELKKDMSQWVELHSRAARAVKEPGQVICHLLAAEKWVEAANQIEEIGEQFLQNGHQTIVSSWIQNLPFPVVQQRYRLMVILGLSNMLKGDLEGAGTSLRYALDLLKKQADNQTRGRVLVRLASLAFICADFSLCADLIKQAAPFIQGLDEQIDFLMLRASMALFCQSDWELAANDLRQALEIVQSSDNPRLWFVFSLYLAPEFIVIPGLMDLLDHFCKTASLRYESQITPLRLGVEDTWANIHLRRGFLQHAVTMAEDVLMVKDHLGGYPFLGMNACLTAAAASSGLGNYTSADGYLQHAVRMSKESELNRALSGGISYPLGRLSCLKGDLDTARLMLRQMSELPIRLPLVDVLQPMLAGWIDLGEHRYARAEKHLLKAVSLQAREWVSSIYGSARLLLASVYLGWEKPQEALSEMEILLNEIDRNGFPGLILQDLPLAAPLLRLCIKKGIQTRQAANLLELVGLSLVEENESSPLLTERQLEILKRMAAGYSNQAIANELVLSLATVKSHGVHILNRLGVSSRMEAVARARFLGILR